MLLRILLSLRGQNLVEMQGLVQGVGIETWKA